MLESALGLENESACATSMLLGRLANDLAASDWKTRPRSRSRLSLGACWSKAVLLSGGMALASGGVASLVAMEIAVLAWL